MYYIGRSIGRRRRLARPSSPIDRHRATLEREDEDAEDGEGERDDDDDDDDARDARW